MDALAAVEDVKNLANEVGRFQLSRFRTSGLKISSKTSVTDLVTEVDTASEERLVAWVRTNYPDHGVLAEEGGGAEREWTWIIDPLDGTVNYAQGLPIFSISIALQHRGQAVLGVVHLPAYGETFWAVRGQGAWRNGERLQVSDKRDLKQCVLGTGFPYDKDTHPINNVAYASHIIPQLRGIRRMGSAAYDLCCVAAGFLDGYWEMTLKPWDVAAGVLMVEEAGGVIRRFREDRGISLVAANPDLAETILAELRVVGV